ncbi:efflux RND transporter periplasmic adaptor subunit [Novipirellula artificiosorum]|uniref:CusB-like beta-barrel domain-containing protein n=1 Tax=Novipirellula artificiosorum TaxID=2528016 RepID=A0A5C6D9Q6_9BACT|nr:HlyD family efflux transporter periplasmic adaptor subunit [Novipirellula artificiosorum]TWU31966.1 hypothetical protein Poly41_58540 [Novipirellula artificiosorum]
MNPTSNPTTFTTGSANPGGAREVHASHLRGSSDGMLLQMRSRLAQASGQVQNAGWLIELLQSLAACDRFSTACHELTSELQSHLKLVRVAVGWKGDANCQHVASISGVANQDAHSDDVQLVQACLDEAIHRESLGCWPSLRGQTGDTDSMLSHKQIAGRDREVVSVSLTTKTGKRVGSLMLVAARGQLSRQPQTIDFLAATASPLADVMAAIQRAEGTRLTRMVRWYRGCSLAKRSVAAAIIVAAIASAWIPVDYRIACPAVIEPIERRFCVAPHDGLLQSAKVEPGDVVSVGETMALMDGREVRWELAGLVAEHRRSAKQHDSYLASHQTNETLQAELEMQRLQSQIDLLSYRESNLTLAAPIAGIVLDGNMDRRDNFPVKQGQVLYEIAPLGQLRIELSVLGEDVSHVAEGMHVEILFAGFGREAFDVTIEKIRPQSEVREDQNVFIAECLLANDDGRLRPGMKGHAKVYGQQHTLGWIVLHRAWEQACMWMPW